MTGRLTSRRMALAVFLLLAAALERFGLAPGLLDLPADYTNETRYAQKNQFRASPDGEWMTSEFTAWRVDQGLTGSGQVLVIQGDLHIYFENGDVNFESSGLYGVDRTTRRNVPGYGNVERSGQYLFPSPVAKTTYTLWNPFYIGPQTVTFKGTEIMDGLLVYVFAMVVTQVNETDGYAYLPDVPERYQVHTNAQGTLWVEPWSGIIVNYQDQGTSSFIDPMSGEPIADFNAWTNTFTPETRAAQSALARQARLRILVLETWLPGGLALAGFCLLMLALFHRNKGTLIITESKALSSL